MMCGISGSGKTYFARHLVEKGFVRLSVDEMIWDAYGRDFADMPFSLQQPIFKEFDSLVAESLKTLIEAGAKVVIDTTMCKRSKRDIIRNLCARYGISPIIVYMKAPLEVLKQRLALRHGEGANDQIIPLSRLEMFFSHFEAPEPDETFITIPQD